MAKEEKGGKKIYWDSRVFLDAVNETVGRIDIINQLLEECASGDIRIYTSTITIAEVQFAQAELQGRALSKIVEAKINKFWSLSSKIRLIEAHELITRDAYNLHRQGRKTGWDAGHVAGYSLQPADSIHLATAKRAGVIEFHTYDIPLKKFESLVGFSIIEPKVVQVKMAFTANNSSSGTSPVLEVKHEGEK